MKYKYKVRTTYTSSTLIEVACQYPAEATVKAVEQFRETFGGDYDLVVPHIVDYEPLKQLRGPMFRFSHEQHVIARLGAGAAKRTESDSGLAYWIATGMTEAEVMDALRAQGAEPEGYRCHCEHDCCNCSWQGTAWLHTVGNRTLVRQIFGRNI